MIEDCAACGMPNDKIASCEFDPCKAVFCDDRETYSECCWNRQPRCVDCGRQGCRDHFDGNLFCFECIEAETKELAEAGRKGEA